MGRRLREGWEKGKWAEAECAADGKPPDLGSWRADSTALR